MLKKILILLLLASPVFAQYSPADLDLIETTYSRTFAPEVINKYLASGITENVRAALLSLSHSSDTSFVKTLTGLSFSKYGDYISFVMAHMGPSRESINYLMKKALFGKESEFQEAAFDALGSIGDKESLASIIDKYNDQEVKTFSGISLAIANFNMRGIKSEDGKDVSILKDELTNLSLPLKRRIQAAFAISRATPGKDLQEVFLKVLDEKGQSEESVILKQYTLSALRKLKSFQSVFSLFRILATNKDWRVRCEAAKVLCYYSFNSREDLSHYLGLLNDINPNVSRQAAISLREVSVEGELKSYLINQLKNGLDSSHTSNTLGEMYLTLAKIEPDSAFDIYTAKQDKIGKVFFYRMLEENFSNPERNLELLVNSSPENKNENLERLSALLSLQSHISGNETLDGMLLKAMSSDFAAAVSVAADGVDSVFIQRHKDELKKIIRRETDIHLNDPGFTESNLSLATLAGKISPEYRIEVLNSMKRATLYSMNSYAFKELGKTSRPKKDMSNFMNAWKNAFIYKFAVVTTDKGSFTIKLNPEMSPISVGNFCYLASQEFFNGIVFHRVVPDFVIQAGDPEGTGWGGPGYEIVSEFSPVPFNRSYVGMASAGMDTEGSQWFVMHSNFPHLNGRYSNFGKVVEGMDVVDTIDQGDKIIRVELK